MIALYILWCFITIGTCLMFYLMHSNYHEDRYLKKLRDERLAKKYEHNYKIDQERGRSEDAYHKRRGNLKVRRIQPRRFLKIN